MPSTIIADYERRFRRKGINVADINGCSDKDIEILKLCQNVDYLPPLYIDFMKRFGCDIDKYVHHFWELSFFSVTIIKQCVIAGYDTDPKLNHQLPDDAFVFSSDVQGVYYDYFLTANHNANPPIFRIYETPKTELVTQIYPLLTHFFIDYIKGGGHR